MARGKLAAGELSQREMVKQALDDLGDAGPTELQEHIQKKFGKEIKKAIISSYKSQLKARSNGAPARTFGPRLSGSIEIRDVSTVQELIRRMGVAQLYSLIKMLTPNQNHTPEPQV